MASLALLLQCHELISLQDITEYFPAKLDWSAHLYKPFTFIEFILGTCN